MSETPDQVITRYLEDAIAAEASFETELGRFAAEGDDDEVQSAFAAHKDLIRSQQSRLGRRLEELGGRPSASKSFFAHVLSLSPRLAQTGHTIEEQTLQNLIIGFTVAASECALYEGLATVAHSAGDLSTERLAREIQAEEQRMAERLWRFLPSRSKIAFNMLTLDEVDVAIETRAAENRIVSS